MAYEDPNEQPHPLTHEQCIEVVRSYEQRASVLIETGTNVGDTPWALRDCFESIFTIELDEEKAVEARARFADYAHVTVLHGDSPQVLDRLLPAISEPVLFWLDAHESPGATPLLDELRVIMDHQYEDTILVDDMQMVGLYEWPTLDEILDVVNARYSRGHISNAVLRLET